MATRAVRNFEELRISTVDWPIVLLDFPPTTTADSVIVDALTYLELLFKEAKQSSEKTYSITDLSRMYQLAPASQRSYISAWMERTNALQKVASLGGATITPSSILRGLVTAIYWFVPPPMPVVFVATRREAYATAMKAFDAARVPLSAELRAELATRT